MNPTGAGSELAVTTAEEPLLVLLVQLASDTEVTEYVPAAVTVLNCGEVEDCSVTPSDQVTVHGPVPVSVTRICLLPDCNGPLPLTVAVGSAAIVTLRVPAGLAPHVFDAVTDKMTGLVLPAV